MTLREWYRLYRREGHDWFVSALMAAIEWATDIDGGGGPPMRSGALAAR